MTRGPRSIHLLAAGAALALLGASAVAQVPAQVIRPATGAAGTAAAAAATNAPAGTGAAARVVSGAIDCKADEMEYDGERKIFIGRGHVVVRQGLDTLKADYMTVRSDTQDAHAIGNVVYEREGKIWRGHELTYNFRTLKGNFGEFNAYVDPFYISAKDSMRTSPNEFVLTNAIITTCKGDSPDYRVRARRTRVVNNNTIYARGVTFYLGVVPIFWLPRWTKHIGDHDPIDVDFVAGYSKRMGGYLLTAVNYRLNRAMRASTHVDYRQKRGFGFGQDFVWGDPRLTYQGALKTYYLNDDSPMEEMTDEEKQAFEQWMDNDRYRIRLSDVHGLSDRDYLTTEINYLSDPTIISDFFDDEYRHNEQPENRISLAHRADKFTAGLTVNKRLNDFFDNVDRLPEATLNVPRMQLGDSPFYLESDNSASWLERVFSTDQTTKTNYSAFRIDTKDTVYYPTRNFGFLNIIPRAGYRGTYYSKTYEYETVTNFITITDTNGAPVLDTNGMAMAEEDIETIRKEADGELRNMYELGIEASFKAFKVLHNEWMGRDDQGLRHVVEPYAVHTYIPEPNLTPAELPQFDKVDKLDKRHDIQIGLRNKLQTKRRQRVHDLVNVDIWTYYLIEKEEGDNDFSDLEFKTILRTADWLDIDFEGAYDMYESQIKTFDTRLTLRGSDETQLSAEYRYVRDRRDQVAGDVKLFPNARWGIEAYARYDIENGLLEEHSYYITHRTDCLGMGLGFSEVDEDWQVWFRIWLTAMPESSIALGR